MKETGEIINNISSGKTADILNDPVKVAKAAHLVYVTDTDTPGISREKRGKSFYYLLEGKEVKNQEVLDRINKLVIPPAWKDVWICTLENGHLQVTGIDTKKRKQYRYHPAWVALRSHTKYSHMIRFVHALPGIRLRMEKDLALEGLPREKVLALTVSLMERTNIRVGNNVYEKLYGSFGLTTLKDKHVDVKGNTIRFSFKGKKGVYHDINLRDPKLARIVRQCKEIPGKELFQYYDDGGKRHAIDSLMVNEYIKEISGEEFTSKDFRTWAGTVNTFLAFKELGYAETEAEQRKKVVEALDKVAAYLGNTRAVCKKYYVHPLIISLYESGSLQDYYELLNKTEGNDNCTDLTPEEKIILSILEKG
ncbi:DNA topoisomerase IB [uncultured Proteiniphilum sp.]|uniref:DNA topoisomerase IB n=1 Tax=uncultured Proteiniphilum sp. TaxID=497637 RepID=UPI00262307D3|nr:DNA topoisomerase IB [uncultured Proteiniphilum sp.]